MMILRTKIRTELLQNDPILSDFQSDNESIRMKIERSYFATVRHQSFSYAIICNDNIVGYYCLKVGTIKYEDEFAYDADDLEYGALLIKYIIIDKRMRNQGIGKAVIEGIMRFVSEIHNSLPIRFLAVDALKEHENWYKGMGFQMIENSDDPNKATALMVLDFVDQEKLRKYIDSCEK